MLCITQGHGKIKSKTITKTEKAVGFKPWYIYILQSKKEAICYQNASFSFLFVLAKTSKPRTRRF